MKTIELAVVVTISPRDEVSSVVDAVDSIKVYTTPSRVVLLADCSGRGTGRVVQGLHREVEVLEAQSDHDLEDAYVHVSRACASLLHGHQFDALFRLGGDGLVVGPNPEADALACFDRDPLVGSASFDRATERRAAGTEGFSLRALFLRQMLGPVAVATDPRRALALWRILPRAWHFGYRARHFAGGGACWFSYSALKALAAHRCLPRMALARVGLSENDVFNLTLRACGYSSAASSADAAMGKVIESVTRLAGTAEQERQIRELHRARRLAG